MIVMKSWDDGEGDKQVELAMGFEKQCLGEGGMPSLKMVEADLASGESLE